MSVDIDLSNYRESPFYMVKQPLYPFVEVNIGGITVTDFNNDEMNGTVMDFSYRRTAKQDVESTADNTFTLTLYDDTAIEIESILYTTLLETAAKTREELGVDTGNTGTGETGSTTTDENSNNDNNNNVTQSRYRFGDGDEDGTDTNPSTPSDDTTKPEVDITDDPNSDAEGENKPDENQADFNISDKINNINISYGWVDRNGNVVVDKDVNANFTKYSLEFEGASTILSLEGTSLDNTLLSSPSENSIKAYPADKWGGVASDIVKDVVDSTKGYTYKKGDIEETEPILGEDGKPKSFIRNGETASVFIKKYLCEEAKSKKSGKVGFDFIVDKGKVTYKPSNISDKGVNVSGTTVAKKGFSEVEYMEEVPTDALGAGIDEIESTDLTDDLNIQISKYSLRLEEYAKLFAYDYGTDSTMFSVGNGSPKEEYKEALDREFPDREDWDMYDRMGASCNVFVATVVRASGLDKKFPHLYMKQQARLNTLGKWQAVEYFGKEKLYSGDIITYKKRNKSRARFTGIYIEQDGGCVACAMNNMSYGCILGHDKLKEILDVDDKYIVIYRVSGMNNIFYPDEN